VGLIEIENIHPQLTLHIVNLTQCSLRLTKDCRFADGHNTSCRTKREHPYHDKTQSASPGSLLEAFAHTIDARSAVASKDFRHGFPKTVPITVTCNPVQWCAGRKRASDQVRILYAHICGKLTTVTEMYKARWSNDGYIVTLLTQLRRVPRPYVT